MCCAYRGQEFLRAIGYYVNNEAPEGEAPSKANVTRTLLAEQPLRTLLSDDDWAAPAVGPVILCIPKRISQVDATSRRRPRHRA